MPGNLQANTTFTGLRIGGGWQEAASAAGSGGTAYPRGAALLSVSVGTFSSSTATVTASGVSTQTFSIGTSSNWTPGDFLSVSPAASLNANIGQEAFITSTGGTGTLMLSNSSGGSVAVAPVVFTYLAIKIVA
jgi:hypothetical protein